MRGDERNDLEAFIDTLPDPVSARIFLDRLEALPPAIDLDSLLVSRLLTLAAYSPFLADTILRNPEHIAWLDRETGQAIGRGKTAEQLAEDLARFSARLVGADERTRLARFKRREFLRIYLRDCLGVATLSEVTEELSSLADVLLADALAFAYQEMVNRHGAPLARDERGRIAPAEFAIVALGKLGCRELNYSSDIDLMFLYGGAGQTAGDRRNKDSVIDNKEFFTSVANRAVQIIGSNTGEGAVYRIDLRLRPYGRDGDLVWEIDRASDYYHTKAQGWERQALIRARASAGSESLVQAFLEKVRGVVFDPEAMPDTLAQVRRAKEKIDRSIAGRTGGFNVKLGQGGIREIEFIAQALQLAHGGREPWVRSAQTLIVLARLAEKGYLSEHERTHLSAAYTFLRTVEHRLQMEHGAQTHTLPLARERLDLVARRAGYADATAFLAELDKHTTAVRAVFNRVFVESSRAPLAPAKQVSDTEADRLINQASAALARLLVEGAHGQGEIEQIISAALPSALAPQRALRNLVGWAESFATYDQAETALNQSALSEKLPVFIERALALLSSQYLSHVLISKPALASVVIESETKRDQSTEAPQAFADRMREAVARAEGTGAKTDALRRVWYRLLLEIGYRDMTGSFASPHAFLTLREINREQTALAEAALEIALEIALGSIGVAGIKPASLPFAVLGLGRLGHTGMDYGSDLDLLMVYDETLWPPHGFEQAGGAAQEFYARLTAELVRVLSSLTREGFLYRIDLRLRPDGKSGHTAQSLSGLLAYLKERASAWEHSAYLKAREVTGDLALGARAREEICEAAFDAARRNPSLKQEMARIRARLEREKARRGPHDIKWGAGGMTDVYFITRYIQLRDSIYYPAGSGTTALIAHLGERGALSRRAAETLLDGYSFLRRLDHWMRLLLDRPGPVLPASHNAVADITRALGIESTAEFERLYKHHTSAIRAVYDETFS